MNADETGIVASYERKGEISLRNYDNGTQSMSKERLTFFPIAGVDGQLKNYKPAFIISTKGSKWKNASSVKSRRVPNSKFRHNLPVSAENEPFTKCEFREFPDKILYWNSKSWMNSEIFFCEMTRLSAHLQRHFPSSRFLLYMDNARYFYNFKTLFKKS